MPSRHKTPLLACHPRDPEIDPWFRAEAKRRGVKLSVVLNEALEAYRAFRTIHLQERNSK